MKRSRGRSGRPWQRAVQACRARVAAGEPCARCGQPIDLNLPHNHRWSVTTGHIVPVVDLPDDHPLHLDPRNHQPEHRACGSSAGSRDMHARRVRHARHW